MDALTGVLIVALAVVGALFVVLAYFAYCRLQEASDAIKGAEVVAESLRRRNDELRQERDEYIVENATVRRDMAMAQQRTRELEQLRDAQQQQIGELNERLAKMLATEQLAEHTKEEIEEAASLSEMPAWAAPIQEEVASV